MKKTAKTENRLPVSRGFYDGIIGRINESLACLSGDNAISPDSVRSCIDLYMTDGTVPGSDAGDIVRMVFALLRPEIDKAMARSAVARKRAGRKRRPKCDKKASEASRVSEAVEPRLTQETLPEPMDENISDEPEPVIALNRRERRLLEREARRLARKMQRS